MSSEGAAKILLEECPSFTERGFDTDIELYTSLISDKKYALAKTLYEKKLIPRYPDEAVRIRIIRYFRKKDYRFRDVYSSAVKDLHGRIIISVKQLIDYLSSLFEENISNPYEVLRRIDKALRVIPAEKTAAVRFIKKLSKYSVLLNHRVENYAKAKDILLRYFDNTLFVKRTLPSVKKEKKKEYKSEKTKRKKKITIDLDAVEFSDQDLSMICINPNIVKRTYKVLAYCRLYWRQIHNQDFEKKIFLYSRKYNTNHYKIFSFVKSGRIKKLGDDVILLELYSLLSKGYRYSVHEDLLMQKIWKKIKPMEIPAAKKKASAGKEFVSRIHGAGSSVGKTGSRIKKSAPEYNSGKDSSQGRTSSTAEHKRKNVQPHSVEKDISSRKSASGYKLERKKKPASLLPEKGREKKQVFSAPKINRQTLKKKLDLLSFREAFDAHEVFSSLLPGYIEKYLVHHRKKGVEKDPYILKGALYIIQNYIKNNYESLTYDWSSSVEKQEISNIGFLVPEIESIIAMCLEEVRMRRMAL